MSGLWTHGLSVLLSGMIIWILLKRRYESKSVMVNTEYIKNKKALLPEVEIAVMHKCLNNLTRKKDSTNEFLTKHKIDFSVLKGFVELVYKVQQPARQELRSVQKRINELEKNMKFTTRLESGYTLEDAVLGIEEVAALANNLQTLTDGFKSLTEDYRYKELKNALANPTEKPKLIY